MEMARQRSVFAKGAEVHGVQVEVATELFNLMEKLSLQVVLINTMQQM